MPLETTGRWRLKSFASAAFGLPWWTCWTRYFSPWLGFLCASLARRRPGPDHPQNQRAGPCLTPFAACANVVLVPARWLVQQHKAAASASGRRPSRKKQSLKSSPEEEEEEEEEKIINN